MGEDRIPYGNRGMTIEKGALEKAIKNMPNFPMLPIPNEIKKHLSVGENKPISLYVDGNVRDFTIDEAIQELYKHPIDSSDFRNIRQCIQSCLEGEKYNEYLIAFKSKMHRTYHPSRKFGLNDVTGIKSIDILNYINQDNETFIQAFDDEDTFLSDRRFVTKKRRELEYNPEYKQLVVSAYITDGVNVILLHTGNNGQTRIEGKYTFIQGHVDFNEKAYIMSQNEFLLDSLKREFYEEVKLKDDSIIDWDIKPKYFINDNSNHIGIEHFGVIYEIRVDNARKVITRLESGEETKHNVELLDLRDYSMFRDNLDNWVQMVLDKLAI